MENNKDMTEDKNFFWQFLSVIFRWRRLLIINALLAAVLTLTVLLFFPNWYAATTTIMPPENDTGGLGMMAGMLPSGLGSLLGSGGLSLPGMATPSDLYATILRSRIVSQAVIDKNNLKEVFDQTIDEKAVQALQDRTKIAVGPEGIITLSYEDTKPERAATVANSFVAELNRVNQENLTSKARAMREFIEQRLNENIRDLSSAEEAYKNFQQIHFAVSLDEQVKAVIGAIADLRGQLVMSEIELGVMKKSLSSTNVRYQEQEYKIEQIKEQLKKLERGDSTGVGSSLLDLSVDETPQLALELVRLTRELKIQETIFELLKQQYEQAKIQELKDTPTIQVLDKAETPRIKSRPKRVFISTMGGILSFALTLMMVLFLEFVKREREKNSVVYEKMQNVTKMLNDDFYWLRNLFGSKRRTDGN